MRNVFKALLLLTLPAFALAAEDPPGRVARLSHIEGEVSVAPAGTQEWAEAVLNRPLTSEDRIWVDRKARAELQIDSAIVHLDEVTDFAFLDLDDDAIAMSLAEGRITVRVLRKREREVIEIDTPNASVGLLHPGEYHIEVDEDGETTVVKARSGEAEVTGEGQQFMVRANEVGTFRGTETLRGEISRLGPRTAFENWANDRARRSESATSSRYVSEGVIGYEDLDAHGRWVHEPEYGYVWYPTYVVAGWAPYRYGRWVWVSPWGWTWIDDARWGFAPFHYGRWAYVRHRWCWVPGPRHVRAVYAPALVAWVGGPHVSVNVSLGHGIGWFPLAPHEVYVPGYWHSHRYLRRVNVSNTIVVNHIHIDRAYHGRYRDFVYRYRDRPHAVTVVEREHFVRGRPVGSHLTHVSDRDLRNWRFEPRPPAIAPQRESLLAGQPRAVRVSNAATGGARHMVARRDLPRRVSFDTEQRAIEANGGRPVARTALVARSSNPKEGTGLQIPRGRGGGDVRAQETRRSMGGAGSRASTQTEREAIRYGTKDEQRAERRGSTNDRSAGRAPQSDVRPERMPARERRSEDVRIERIAPGDASRSPKTYSSSPSTSSTPSSAPVRSFTQRESTRPLESPRVRERVREQPRAVQEAPRQRSESHSVNPNPPSQPRTQPQAERRSSPAPAQRSSSMRSSERQSSSHSQRGGQRSGRSSER
jgi:hypothetical protein